MSCYGQLSMLRLELICIFLHNMSSFQFLWTMGCRSFESALLSFVLGRFKTWLLSSSLFIWCTCVPSVCVESGGPRRACWLLWNWSHGLLWPMCESLSSEVTTKPSLQPSWDMALQRVLPRGFLDPGPKLPPPHPFSLLCWCICLMPSGNQRKKQPHGARRIL